ncbi:hypothetical protein DVH24_003980 [Malus domestica]|uniref:Uncharacterized protein n=1 Tax=Malus domestica TaxID=3750 RepID=A0A498K7F1_MALDO|nr:hypothetical protein DVH24_003980 [Malus domestica]
MESSNRESVELVDGMSKRHNYNWNSHSISCAVWNAHMRCGMLKLMHHLVLQIHDRDWHPIGDTKFVWSLISSVGIFYLGSGATIIHGVQNLWTSQPLPTIKYAPLVIGGSFIIEGASLLVAIQDVKKGAAAEGIKLRDLIWRGHDPTSGAVLAEDGAAVTGLAIATASLVAVKRT